MTQVYNHMIFDCRCHYFWGTKAAIIGSMPPEALKYAPGVLV